MIALFGPVLRDDFYADMDIDAQVECLPQALMALVSFLSDVAAPL